MKLLVYIFDKYRGKAIGVTIGFIFSLLVLIIGLWRTLFILLCIGAGYYIGNKFDKGESFLEFLDKILPKGMR
ncbi:MAG: hypothetical protein PWP48_567 [Clostridiales bacterium]|jgi:uncharacterized membrane protein|nr:hypothetical protein [Clostridiales bacterium]MDK2991334.1 hypothetical protein [Clostridiales bacterium]